MDSYQLETGQEFNFFASKIASWSGWLASLVVDIAGNTIGADGTSKTVGNHTDLQLLLALRAKASVIVTTGKTARAEGYKPSRFAPIAFITRNPDSLADVPAVARPGHFANIILSSSANQPNPFQEFDIELNTDGPILFEGGVRTLTQLLQSDLPTQLVLSIANVPESLEISPTELLSKALPFAPKLRLKDAFRAGPNVITHWSKP